MALGDNTQLNGKFYRLSNSIASWQGVITLDPGKNFEITFSINQYL